MCLICCAACSGNAIIFDSKKCAVYTEGKGNLYKLYIEKANDYHLVVVDRKEGWFRKDTFFLLKPNPDFVYEDSLKHTFKRGRTYKITNRSNGDAASQYVNVYIDSSGKCLLKELDDK